MVRETLPDVVNFSCWTPVFQHPSTPLAGDIARTAVSSVIGVVVSVVNVIFIIVVNSRRHAKYLPFQPRYLLTSLAVGDLLKGVVVVPLSAYPVLFHCWPYGRHLCALQAVILPLLHQQAALTLSLLALDRYCCMLHPAEYRRHVSRKLCVFLVLLSWVLCVAFFVGLFLPLPHFYFNHNGNFSCEPFHTANSRVILVACTVYFPTTMVTMYCYGTVFHLARTSFHRFVCATVTTPEVIGAGTTVEKMIMSERRLSMRTCRLMAVLSLAFIILITPWTLRQVIAACTNSRMPMALDYGVWVISIGGGIVLLFIFWLLSPAFRRATAEKLHNKICCGNVYYEDPDDFHAAHSLQNTPATHRGVQSHSLANTPSSRRPNGSAVNAHSNGGGRAGLIAALNCTPTHRQYANGRTPNHAQSLDAEAVGEKFWGEILERTVSSSSLQNMQRIYRNGHLPELKIDEHSQFNI
ncbi:trace amine-associated receptor 8c isoform X2 [Oratosquilla oratoria]|uniref:trace amine-associated receptor 8c isoform X2 n=1 Tax=Oratosquilla oratoria TaxID=337810 RepID=UPI003F757C7C